VASAYSIRPLPDARVSTPLRWDEVPTVEAEAFTIETVPARFAAIGDPGAGIDEAVGSLEALLELSRQHEAEGEGDAPWPPNYAKQEGEPPRVQPSRARRPKAEYEPGRGVAGGPPPDVAAERAAAVAAGDPNAGLPTEWEGSRPTPTGRRKTTIPVIEISRAASKAEALEGLERWKVRHPGVGEHLEPADVLVDGMRGRSSLWYRVRVNLTHVPEAQRPAQEALDPDYDPWAGYEWPDKAGQLERAPRKRKGATTKDDASAEDPAAAGDPAAPGDPAAADGSASQGETPPSDDSA
jgi:bifunctional non-homologous end joining protein LigD